MVTNRLQDYLITRCQLKANQLSDVLAIAGEYQDILVRQLLRGTPAKVAVPAGRSRSRKPKRTDDAGGDFPPLKVNPTRVKVTRPPSYAVIVKGPDQQESPEALHARLMLEMGDQVPIRVKSIRPVQSGVRVETCSPGELEVLQNSVAMKNAGLSMERALQPQPRVIVMDVPMAMPIETLMENLYQKNCEGLMTREAFEVKVRVISRSGDGATGNLVLELPDSLAEEWAKRRQLYLRWTSHRVRVLENMLSCYRCYDLGHRSFECKHQGNVCRNCGLEGHLRAVCPNPTRCNNCRMKGLPDGHSITSVVNCPLYRAKQRRLAKNHNG